jgi:hypothetical protein
MFKLESAIKPEHRKQSPGSKEAGADRVINVKGFEDQDFPQARKSICADDGRRLLLESKASANTAGKELIVLQFLRVFSAIAVGENPKIPNYKDFLLMADDLIYQVVCKERCSRNAWQVCQEFDHLTQSLYLFQCGFAHDTIGESQAEQSVQ